MQSCGHWMADGFVPHDCCPQPVRSNQRNSGRGALACAVPGGLALRCCRCQSHPALHDRGTPLGSINFEAGAAALRKFRQGREQGGSHVAVRSFRDNDGFPHGRRRCPPLPPDGSAKPPLHGTAPHPSARSMNSLFGPLHRRFPTHRYVRALPRHRRRPRCWSVCRPGVSLLELPFGCQRSSSVKTACEPVSLRGLHEPAGVRTLHVHSS